MLILQTVIGYALTVLGIFILVSTAYSNGQKNATDVDVGLDANYNLFINGEKHTLKIDKVNELIKEYYSKKDSPSTHTRTESYPMYIEGPPVNNKFDHPKSTNQ